MVGREADTTWKAAFCLPAVADRPPCFYQCSLEQLRALPSLRALRVAGSGLGSLQGVEALSQLTSLDASCNGLERLPSLEGEA